MPWEGERERCEGGGRGLNAVMLGGGSRRREPGGGRRWELGGRGLNAVGRGEREVAGSGVGGGGMQYGEGEARGGIEGVGRGLNAVGGSSGRWVKGIL